MSSCSMLPPPLTPSASPSAFSTSDVVQIDIPDEPVQEVAQALIMGERNATITGDLATLAQLWTTDARIVDGRGTKETADDHVWSDRNAILDRYTLAVFPSPPPPLDDSALALLAVHAEKDRIVAQLGVDTWTFVKQDGQWRIRELRYN